VVTGNHDSVFGLHNEGVSVSADDRSMTAKVLTSDKPDDKLASQFPELEELINAWPTLPENIRKGILAMIHSFQ
jgi:hypothetical protein